MSTCNKCKCVTSLCGCEDTALTTNLNCLPACPNPEPCAETFSDCCVVHTNDTFFFYIDEETPQGFTINKGDRMCEILQKLLIYFQNPGCVDPTSACNSVVGLQSVSVTSNTINIQWNSAIGATGYILQIKLSTDPLFTNTTLPGLITATVIGGLIPNTEYDIRIATICTNPPNPDCFSVTIKVKTLN